MLASRAPYFVASALLTALACGGSARDERSEPSANGGASGSSAVGSGAGRGGSSSGTAGGSFGGGGIGGGGIGGASVGYAGSSNVGGRGGTGVLPSELCSASPNAATCVDNGSYPRPPVELFAAESLGPGSLFVALRESSALARAPDGWYVVTPNLSFGDLRIDVSDLVFPTGSPLPEIADFWRASAPDIAPHEMLVLVCDTPGCRLLGANFSPGGYALAEFGVVLDPSWQARGLFVPGYDPSAEVCIYGNGIHCYSQGMWRQVFPAVASPFIAVHGQRALTEDGRVFTALSFALPSGAVSSEWVLSEAPVRFSRLSASGAIGQGELWLSDGGQGLMLCSHSPGLVAGDGYRNAVDENGFVYLRELRPGGYSACRWPDALSPLIGEGYLNCGITSNWIGLTSQHLLGLSGPPFCALD
jgi:hypothetical protein